MKRIASLLILLLPIAARATPPSATTLRPQGVGLEDYLNHPILSVEVNGPDWAHELARNLPIRQGMWLSRDRLERSVKHFHQNRTEDLAEVRVLGEIGEAKGKKGVKLIFRIEPVRHVVRISFEDHRYMDNAALLRAVNIETGSDFWPDIMDNAAQQVALLYQRAGWRQTEVEWWATTAPGGVAITFIVHRSEPTLLLKLEFPGDKALTEAEMADAFPLKPGSQLSMDAIDEGIVELKSLLRSKSYYRADVGLPHLSPASLGDQQVAVVEIPVTAGPRFLLQVRGNRHLDDDMLLEHLHYSGDEELDEATEHDLAERIRALYELAGFPLARVEVHENAPLAASLPTRSDRPTADVRIGPQSEISVRPDMRPTAVAPPQTVTFLITEGPPIRVVGRRFEGDLLKEYPDPIKGESAADHESRLLVDLQRRVDLALEDTVPDELVGKLDQSWIRAAHLGGSPGERFTARPRVQPHEVFSRAAYKRARDQIKALYQGYGYLDVTIPEEKLELGENGEAHVVISIDAGPKSVVAAVDVEGVKEMPADRVQKLITVHVGEPLSYAKIDDTEKAVVQLYQNEGFLSAAVDDREDPRANDPTHYTVTFTIVEGAQVRISGINIQGATHTDPKLVQRALTDGGDPQAKPPIPPQTLKVGDLVTPKVRTASVANLLKLGTFVSAAVDPQSTTSTETPLVVTVHERPSYTVDLAGGLSSVDGPRVSGQFTAAHLLGSANSFSATAKVNYPIFRLCLPGRFCDQQQLAAETPPTYPVEGRITAGFTFPVFGAPGESPLDQHVEVIAENLLRPAYYLRKASILGTINGLPHGRFGPVEVTTLLQAETELDYFETTSKEQEFTASAEKTPHLPNGPTQLISLRPQMNIDGRERDARGIVTGQSGGQASLIFDFSRSLDVLGLSLFSGPNKVAMISALLTGGGYIPIYRPKRVVMALSGRVGEIFTEPWAAQVIGTKTFFLGGTSSLRGFSEDAVIPQDTREQLDKGIHACNALASGAICDSQSSVIIQNPQSLLSQGGSFVVAGRGELRFGLSDSLDGNVFLDAGNLWSNPMYADLRKLRYSAGFGVSVPLPIGPAAIDLGFNLSPDPVIQESLFQVHFAIGL